MIAVSLMIYLEGTRSIISSEEDIEIVAETQKSSNVISLVEKMKPDVLFLDVAIPKLDVVNIIDSIKEKSPDTKVLLLLPTRDRDKITNFISLGAKGCLTYRSSPKQIIQAIRAVSKEKIWT